MDVLREEVSPELDAFDLICHVAYGQPPLTRKERAAKVKKQNIFRQYGVQAQKVLQALLEHYEDARFFDLEDPAILHQRPFNEMGRPLEIARFFGGNAAYQQAIRKLNDSLYAAS